MQHPEHQNIVKVLQAFEYEDNGVQTLNLIFAYSVCSLEQMLCGTVIDQEVLKNSHSLWSQFEGLASALERMHLHWKMAHQDLKPSNILLHVEKDDQGPLLIARIADFGLAADLKGADIYASNRYLAAGKWPEVTDIRDSLRLVRNDVWGLGVVFVELLTFLVLGRNGSRRFHRRIETTDNTVYSHTVNDAKFDGGFKAKVEVVQWLSMLAAKDNRAAEVEDVFRDMVDEAPRRPTINTVVQRLQAVSRR